MEQELLAKIVAQKEKKDKSSYTIESKVLAEFNKICIAKGYTKSQILENLLKVFIEQEKSIFGTSSVKN